MPQVERLSLSERDERVETGQESPKGRREASEAVTARDTRDTASAASSSSTVTAEVSPIEDLHAPEGSVARQMENGLIDLETVVPHKLVGR
jgi:hypothetical protein